jgi:small GTP-binding protein
MNTLMVKERTHLQTGLEHIVALYKLIQNNNDKINAVKIEELYEKLNKKELVISFAGHFSAGKSSMINAILGEEILPKSPIPTSANVVKITTGEGVARVFFHQGHSVEYKEPYDIDMIKAYSKDKDTIKKLEISTTRKVLPHGVAMMDTPGIDAADDADRLMTEASLHLVDILFYVMDYNHVQSEVNLQFLRMLQEKKIPFYVIINQVDKHDEREIPFATFDKSVKQTFEQWKIIPEHIYYASLLDDATEHNQFSEIKEKLFSIMHRDKELSLNIDHAVEQVVGAHKQFLKKKYEDKMAAYSGDESESEYQTENINELEQKLIAIRNETLTIKEHFLNDLNNTLKNAYLMPSNLRDKAEAFLASQQSDFKVGLFGSKKKTEKEQDARLTNFLTLLQENIEAAVQWKLHDKFNQLLKEYDLYDPTLQEWVRKEITISYTKNDLFHATKSGAKMNGGYVLNYTNELAADIKSKYRKQALSFWNVLEQAIQSKNNDQINFLETKLEKLKKTQSMKNERNTLQVQLDAKIKLLTDQLNAPMPDEAVWQALKDRIADKDRLVVQAGEQNVHEDPNPHTHLIEEANEMVPKSVEQPQSVAEVLDSVAQTIDVVHELPGFQAIINDLKEKQFSLEHRAYTIALFGAFSAGKSSFANALLGERVLPVSPNPTTATVNRIRPVTDSCKHGTVVVSLKDHDTLVNDLLLMTNKFSPKENRFPELLQWIEDHNLQHDPRLNSMYQAYLQAMITGFPENKNYIGKSVTISIDDFAAYVSDETKACFIESIDLYYDCSITRHGITLVDTPGADSVNARHTNVAFDYIKHADAILYVTYYNHALSRADKDFLMQLGRVKESFELDKMYFLINAADLAADSEELKLVANYVQEQLMQLGIRFPQLYPVSSKQSLQNKLHEEKLNEQMQHFETDFYQFIYNDLSALTIQSALWDINRAYSAMKHYTESLHLDEQQKEAQQNGLLNKKTQLMQEITDGQTTVYADQIQQKTTKQLFYVQERLSIRFHDMFKEFFNPTTITESGRKAHEQLRNSTQDLIDYAGFELHQEIQAVSLRVEAYIQSQAAEFYQLLTEKCMQIDRTLTLPNFESVPIETPGYEHAFQQLDITEFDKAIALFKGTKAFFEKNEKQKMKEVLFEHLQPFTEQYLEENAKKMNKSYHVQWDEITNMIKVSMTEYVEKHMNDYLEMLSSPVDIGTLEHKQSNLETILKKYGKGKI